MIESCESRRLLSGTVTGFVRLDSNNDGVAETPLGAVSVFIDQNGNNQLDPSEPKFFTDGASHLPGGVTPNPNYGRYTISDLAPGTYRVRVQPAHYHRIYQPTANSGTYFITITANESYTDIDFGVHTVSAVGGIIYHDANGDGVFTMNHPVTDADGHVYPGVGDDPLIVGITAYLDLNNNGVHDNDEPTNISRDYVSYFHQNYNFRDLDPGTYTIRLLDTPAGYGSPNPAYRTSTVSVGQETEDDNFGFTLLSSSSVAWPTVDMNGDDKADVILRSGVDTSYWALDGAQRIAVQSLTSPGAAWSLGAAADFDGDGHTDLVYHNNATGASQIWRHNGTTVIQQIDLPVVANTAWRIVGTGDFNHDGKFDLVWRNSTTGQNTLWLMNGTTLSAFRALPSTADLNWAVAGVSDFDHDGIDDIVWRNKVSGKNTLWLMNNSQRVAAFKALDTTIDQNWQIAGVDDYNNDGNADIFWRNLTLNRSLIWTYNATQRTAFVNVIV